MYVATNTSYLEGEEGWTPIVTLALASGSYVVTAVVNNSWGAVSGTEPPNFAPQWSIRLMQDGTQVAPAPQPSGSNYPEYPTLGSKGTSFLAVVEANSEATVVLEGQGQINVPAGWAEMVALQVGSIHTQ